MANELTLKAPFEALAKFLTEVWTLLRADKSKSPKITSCNQLDSTNAFDVAQAMYVVNDNLILISDAFAKASWQDTPSIPDCDLLPKYRFEKEYRKFESWYHASILKNSQKWDLLTKALLMSLKLI